MRESPVNLGEEDVDRLQHEIQRRPIAGILHHDHLSMPLRVV